VALNTTTLAHFDAVWAGRQPLHLDDIDGGNTAARFAANAAPNPAANGNAQIVFDNAGAGQGGCSLTPMATAPGRRC